MALPKNYSIWLAVDYDGIEKAFWHKPKRCEKHREWWGDKMVLPHGSGGAFSVDPSTICQFTGLRDKDGKDIFENDLLYDEDSGIVSAIKWKRHICGYVYEKAGMFSTIRVIASHTGLLKIVGNKFDNEK